MAALRQRLTEEKADWIIYVTDVGQAQHFTAIFKAARMAGWLPADPTQPPRVDHVGFGLVLGPDGRRLRSRDGSVSISPPLTALFSPLGVLPFCSCCLRLASTVK